jgi:putative methionine-R-sulfoxide reductase with GAF domain
VSDPFTAWNRIHSVNKQIQSANRVLTSVKQRLASAAKTRPTEVLDGVVQALTQGGQYAWTAIYVAEESLGVCGSLSGPAPAKTTIDDLKAEIAAPIRAGGRTMGLLLAQTGGPEGASRQDQEQLHQVTELIAQYLTTNPIPTAPRKMRQKLQDESAVTQKPKGPHSARPAARKAAAGEQSPR